MEDIFYSTPLGRVHCRETGAGQPLFLMHSNGRSAHEFDALAEHLADRFRLIAWDLPGQGDSDRMQRHVSAEELAAVAVDIASRNSHVPPIIGGSSIGATLAIAAGAFHADKISGIVVIELPVSRDRRWWENNWTHVEGMFSCPDEDPVMVARRYRTVTPELAQRLRIDRHKAGGAAMMQILWAGRTIADDIAGHIARLTVPALFINGDRGLATDAPETLPALNKAAQVAMIADSGHFPQTDDPAAVAAAISQMFALTEAA